MKHLLSLLTVAVIAIVAWGCSEGTEAEAPISVSQGALTFSSNAGTMNVEVTAGNNWEPISSQSWCTAERVDKKTLKVAVTKNYAAKNRTAQITISSGSQSAVVDVSQKKGSGTFDGFEVTSVAFDGLASKGTGNAEVSCKEAEYVLHIKTFDPKYTWKAEVIEGADFVSVPDNKEHRGSDYLTITVKANDSIDVRTAQLKIESELEGALCTYLLNISQASTNRNEDPIVNKEINW